MKLNQPILKMPYLTLHVCTEDFFSMYICSWDNDSNLWFFKKLFKKVQTLCQKSSDLDQIQTKPVLSGKIPICNFNFIYIPSKVRAWKFFFLLFSKLKGHNSIKNHRTWLDLYFLLKYLYICNFNFISTSLPKLECGN